MVLVPTLKLLSGLLAKMYRNEKDREIFLNPAFPR